MKKYAFAFCGVMMPLFSHAACDVRGIGDGAPVLCGVAAQGGMLYGQVSGWDVYRDSARGERMTRGTVFVLGLGRDAPTPLTLVFCRAGDDDDCQTYTYDIARRTYREQHVTVPDKFVDYPADVQKRIDADNALIVKRRGESLDDLALDFMNLTSPLALAQYRVSGVYGSARVFNGVPKSPHKGIDIAAPRGTVVRASAPGRVVITRDMYLSGNTVFISHGHGVLSAYLHLDDIKVRDGDQIAAGDVVGVVGSTGRSSGPHLHFGVYHGQIALDPELFIK